MKIHCPISGVSYEVSFPVAGHATSPHPMLSLSVKELNETFLPVWAAGSMSSELQHLLALSYLCKLPVDRMDAFSKKDSVELSSFWAAHMETIARLATSLENRPQNKLPRLAVGWESIPALKGWVESLSIAQANRAMPISDEARKLNSAAWKGEVTVLMGGKVSAGMDQKEIDSLILRGLRGSPLSRTEAAKYPQLITRWIENAAPFPTAKVALPSGKKVTIAEHWRHILEVSFSKDGALDLLCEDVNAGDLEEILEHCYTEIPANGIMASLVWDKLEAVKDVLEEFRNSTTPKKLATPKFTGTTDELASLLGAEEPPVQTRQAGGPSLMERLALKIKK